MKTSLRVLGLLVVHLWLGPVSADAQAGERPSGLTEGNHSISFRLPESGIGSVGIWRMLSHRTGLGLILDLGVRRLETGETGQANSTRIGIQPMVKRYVGVGKSVAPFFFGGLFANHSRRESTESATRGPVSGETWHAGASAGGGAEWFIVPQVSLGGRVGVQAGISRAENQSELETVEKGLFFDSFTSNLALHIYF